jgi:hypothetical protein
LRRGWERHGQVLQCLDIFANRVGQANDNREAPIAFEQHTGFPAPDRCADHVLDGKLAEANPRDFGFVDLDGEELQTCDLFDPYVLRAFDAAQDGRNLVGCRQHRLELLAEDLHGEVAARASEQLVEAHLDRLREFEIVAGQLLNGFLDALDQRVLCERPVGPFLLWLEDYEGIRNVRRHRIGREFRSACLREHVGDLGKRTDRLFDLGLHALRLAQRGARDTDGVHGDVFLVKGRHELLAQPCEQDGRSGEQYDRREDERRRGAHRRV